MKDLFLTVVEISISVSFIILILLIFSSYLNRKYAAKWKYLIWIAIAVRLIVPLNFKLPVQKIVVDVPTQITTPIHVNVGNETPILLQTDHKMEQITPLDIAACLWLVGCLLSLSVHIVSFLRFKKRLIRDGAVVEDEKILRHICRLSGELCIKPNIQVVQYPDAGSPMITGFFKPVLVLPDDGYTEEELFFILKHELIHLKRHDIYFKLLFVVAEAVHWFNPLIYIMQKEAVIDMELSCDEMVIRQTPYAVRKAYTETLFSTLSRQYKKETTLTTQFYGGKRVMKKRFKNILMQSKKRNGIMVSICVIGLVAASGMLIGCSVADDISSVVQAQTQYEAENPDTQIEERQEIPVITDAENGQENAEPDADHGQENVESDADREESTEVVLPDSVKSSMKKSVWRLRPQTSDSEEMKKVVEEFAAAYFSGDEKAVKSLLPDSYAWTIEVYEGTGTISETALKGLPDAGEQEIGSVWTVSMQYRDSTYEDMLQYLTFELVKRSTGWEIQFYGMEG